MLFFSVFQTMYKTSATSWRHGVMAWRHEITTWRHDVTTWREFAMTDKWGICLAVSDLFLTFATGKGRVKS